VTLSDLPPPFESEEAKRYWVGPPTVVTELAASSASAPPPTYKTARLQCTPHYRNWGAEGVVNVYDDEIVPSVNAKFGPRAVYVVQAIHLDCATGDEANYYHNAIFVANGRCGNRGA